MVKEWQEPKHRGQIQLDWVKLFKAGPW